MWVRLSGCIQECLRLKSTRSKQNLSNHKWKLAAHATPTPTSTVNRTHTYTVSITSVFLIFICLHSLDMLHNYCYDTQKHVLKPTIFCGLPTQEPLQISFADEQCDLVYSVGTHRKLRKLHLTQVKWGGSGTNTVKWTWKAKMSPAQIPDSRQSMQNYILIYSSHKRE